MKFINWIRSFRVRRQNHAAPAKLICEDCGCQIHRHERYKIVRARHRDCKDKKLVGQQSIPAREDV